MPTQRSTGPCLEGKSRQLVGAVLMQHGGGRGAVQVREHTDCAGKAWQAHSLTCWMGGRDFCIAELLSDVLGTFPSLSINLLSLNVHHLGFARRRGWLSTLVKFSTGKGQQGVREKGGAAARLTFVRQCKPQRRCSRPNVSSVASVRFHS